MIYRITKGHQFVKKGKVGKLAQLVRSKALLLLVLSLLSIQLTSAHDDDSDVFPDHEDCRVDPHDTCPDGCARSVFNMVVRTKEGSNNLGATEADAIKCENVDIELNFKVVAWRSLGNNLLHSIRPMLYDIENDTLMPIINGESIWRVDTAEMITSSIGGEVGSIDFWEPQNDIELGAGLYVDRPNDPYDGLDAYRLGRGLGTFIRPDEAVECFEIESVTVECRFVLTADCSKFPNELPLNYRLAINVAGDGTTGGGQFNFCLDGDTIQSCFDKDAAPIGYACPEKCNSNLRAFPTLVGTDLGADNFTDAYYYNEIWLRYECPEILDPEFIRYDCENATVNLPNGDTIAFPSNRVNVLIAAPPATNNIDLTDNASSNDNYIVTSSGNTLLADTVAPEDTITILSVSRGNSWDITLTDPRGCTVSLNGTVPQSFTTDEGIDSTDFVINLAETICFDLNPVPISVQLEVPPGGTLEFSGPNVVDGDITDGEALFTPSDIGSTTIKYLYTNDLGCQFIYDQTITVLDSDINIDANAVTTENCDNGTYTAVVNVTVNDDLVYNLTSTIGVSVSPNTITGTGSSVTTQVTITGVPMGTAWDLVAQDETNACVTDSGNSSPGPLGLAIASVVANDGTCNNDGTYNMSFIVTYNPSATEVGDFFTYTVTGENTNETGIVQYLNDEDTGTKVIQLQNLTVSPTNIDIEVVDNRRATCSSIFSYLPPQNCDCDLSLIVDGIATSCNANGTYDLSFDVAFDESSATISDNFIYEISLDGTSISTGIRAYETSPQTVTVENLTSTGGQLNLTIADFANPFCTNGNNNSDVFTAPSSLSIDAGTLTTVCDEDGGYNILFDVTHGIVPAGAELVVTLSTGRVETLSFDNDGRTSVNITGVQEYDSQVTITVGATGGDFCLVNAVQTITPNQDCKCLINVSLIPPPSTICLTDSTYQLTFNVVYQNEPSDSFIIELVKGTDQVFYTDTFAYEIGANTVTITIDDLPVEILEDVNNNQPKTGIVARDSRFPATCESDGLAFYDTPTDVSCACPIAAGAIGNINTVCEGNLTDDYTLSFTVNYTTGSIPESMVNAGFNYAVISGATEIAAGSQVYDRNTNQVTITLSGLSAREPIVIVVEDATGLFPFCDPVSSNPFTPPTCACSLSQVGGINLSECDTLTGLYNVFITIAYENPNSNNFSYSINGSPSVLVPYASLTSGTQQLVIPNLTGNGEQVSIEIQDETDANCALPEPIIFTAPFCLPCQVNVVSATPSLCDEVSNAYNLQVEVAYVSPSSTNFIVEVRDSLTGDVIYTEAFAYTQDPTGTQTVFISDTLQSDGRALLITVRDEMNTSCSANAGVFTNAPEACVTCELEIISVNNPILCNGDGTYNLTINVHYEGVEVGDSFVLQIEDEFTGTFEYLSEAQTQPIIVVNLIGDGQPKTVTVRDLNDAQCIDIEEDAYTAPDCSCTIGVTATPGQCLLECAEQELTYAVTLTIEHDNTQSDQYVYQFTEGGVLYSDTLTFNDTQMGLTFLQLDPKNDTSLHFTADGETIEVTVFSLGDAACTSTTTFEEPTDCEDTNCNITISSVETSNCNPDGTYNVAVVFSYNCFTSQQGFFYTINGMTGSIPLDYVDSLSQRVELPENIPGNGQPLQIVIFDNADVGCFATYEDDNMSPLCECDLSATSISPACSDNGTFDLVLNVEYNVLVGDSFTVNLATEDGGIIDTMIAYSGVSPQSVVIPDVDGGCDVGVLPDDLIVTLTDQTNAACTSATTMEYPNCCNCNINIVNVEITNDTEDGMCNADSTYNLKITFNYQAAVSDTFELVLIDEEGEPLVDGNGTVALTNEAYNGEGVQTICLEHIVNPNVPLPQVVTIFIKDQESLLCNETASYEAPVCPECLLNDAGECVLHLIKAGGSEGLRIADLEVCYLDGVDADAPDAFVGDTDNYELGFILHTSETDVFGTILAFNTDGIFMNNGSIPNIENWYEQDLYITPVISTKPFGLNFDLNDDCLKLGEPATVLFHDELRIEDTYECNSQELLFSYTIPVSGINGVAPYKVTIEVDLGNSQTLTKEFNNISGGLVIDSLPYLAVDTMNLNGSDYVLNKFTVTITDAIGCTNSETFGKTCGTTDIDLLSFTGQKQGANNLLKWVTAAEVNNDYFILEHSFDGTNFSVIGNEDGNGNTNTAKAYSFVHKNVPAGLSYYRLKDADFDGKVTEHGIITLLRGEVPFEIVSINPVPVTSYMDVEFTTNVEREHTIIVTDITGRVIETQTIEVNKGSNVHRIQTKKYSAGMYFITVENTEESITQKVVKQ